MRLEQLKISLAAARVNAGMTQDDVSKCLKISKNTLVSWEKQKTEPTATQAEELCRLYGLKLDQIKWC